MASVWYVVLALEVLAAAVFYLRQPAMHAALDFWPMARAAVHRGVLVLIEFAAQ